MKKLLIVGISLGIALIMGGGSSASAQESEQHITVSPVSSDISLNPGGLYNGVATIRNEGAAAFNVAASVTGYHAKNLTYDPVFTPVNSAGDVTSWITLGEKQIDRITPGSTTELPFTIRVPATTKPGGYYAVIFSQTTPTGATSQSIIRHNRVGTILYITVNGAMQREGSARADSVTMLSFDGSVAIPVIASNTGGVHFTSDYTVRVTSLFGKQLLTKSVSAPVLPQTERRLVVDWKADAPFGIYKIDRTVATTGDATKLAIAVVIVLSPALLIGVVCLLVAAISFIAIRRGAKK